MSTETKVLGITSGNNPPRIQFETETLSLILPNYDFVAALYGPNTEGKILFGISQSSNRNFRTTFRDIIPDAC